MENLNIKRNETETQYIWRICSQKEILGYNWKQIAEILNKNLQESVEEYLSESAYRKKYQQAKKFKEEVFDIELVNVDDRLDEYAQMKMEAKMAIKEAQTERMFTNRQLRESTRARMIQDKTNKAIKVECDLPLPEFETLKINETESEYLLGISDVHAYKLINLATNKYNKNELERRMNVLTSEVIEVINKEDINKLTILSGGDSFQNILRTTDIGVLEYGVIETVIKYRRFLASWLRELSKHVKIDYIHLTSANHSEYRALGARTSLMARDNFELDMGEYLYDMLETNERINVILPQRDYHTFNLAGYDMIAHHGHKIRSADKFIKDRVFKDKVFYSYGIFGHLHNDSITNISESGDVDAEILRLPSIMGTDAYAENNLNTGSKASSVMYRFTKGKGRDRAYKFILN